MYFLKRTQYSVHEITGPEVRRMNFQLQGGGVLHSGGYADRRQRGRWKFRQVIRPGISCTLYLLAIVTKR